MAKTHLAQVICIRQSVAVCETSRTPAIEAWSLTHLHFMKETNVQGLLETKQFIAIS